MDPGSECASMQRFIVGAVAGSPAVTAVAHGQLSRTNRVVACLGALMILLLITLLLGLALAIKLLQQGPVMFVQKRSYRGRKFGMYKFRTMVANAEEVKGRCATIKHGADAIDFKVDQDPRITGIGGFLRRTSLDELPNLINVVTGDMRLVGPRPTSFNAYRYEDSHLARLAIYPE